MDYRSVARISGLPPGAILVILALWIPSGVSHLQFKWSVGAWGECEHEGCGPGGRQFRDVWCTLQTGHPVLNANCEEEFKPAVRRECTRPCSQDVVLDNPEVYDKNREPYSPEYNDYENSRRGHAGGKLGPDRDDPAESVGIGSEYDGFGGRDFRPGWYPQDSNPREPPRLPITSATSDVEWVVSQWSSCKLESGTKACGRNSGLRHRNVTCERRDSQMTVAMDRCLRDEPMPSTQESCELLCRQDCVVSEYSELSGCDSTCQLTNQTRTRVVIVPPRHRGSHCPDLSEMYSCENCSNSYTYQFSPWLPCISIEGSYSMNAHPLIGYQTREISCLQSKGVLTSLRHCTDKLPFTNLKKHRACVIAQDCQVSDWSPLVPHNSSCIGYDGIIQHGYMVRTRQVLQLPMGNGDPCPSKLVDYIRLNKEDIKALRSCKKAKWIMSSWSLCQTVPGYNHCGTGIQRRKAICVEPGDDGVERPVDETRCPHIRPTVSQSCTMECNWDCSVSQWSAWSVCQDGDCEMTNVRRKRTEFLLGKKFRTREILTLPGPAGNICPHLSEIRMCQPEPCFTWNITLGVCEPTTRGGCGEGTQLKKAICLNRAGVKVRDRFCHENLHSEQTWTNCYVPCPEDCVLSEWGSWSPCPNPCTAQTGYRVTRSRTRQVLAYHGQGRSTRACPNQSALRQSEHCQILYDCTTYQWEATAWGACRLNMDNPHVQCGLGTQSRKVECYTSTGMRVSDDKCIEKIRPKNVQSCLLECPVDCHLTEWSEWSACGVTCLPQQARQIYPTQLRKRFILQYPQYGGVACPTDLDEEQSCLNLPVCHTFFWDTSDWSECVLPPEYPKCGQGLRARNMTCKQHNNQDTKLVPVSVCLSHLGTMPDVTETCYSPCQSECQLSPWSQWTQCGPRCEKTRFRFRNLLGESKNEKDCRDTEKYPRDQHEDCVCNDQLPMMVGGWSDCIIDALDMVSSRYSSRPRGSNETGYLGLGSQPYCGDGKRYMVQSCQNPTQDIFGVVRCADPQEQICTIPCPVDCQTTPWSQWSACSVKCGSGLQQRERRIMTLPADGGRKCPFMFGHDKEIQTKVCSVECSYHVWRADDWGPCFPNVSRSCGEGTHSRPIRCVSVGPDGSEMNVDLGFCYRNEEPSDMKSCSLPCPGECVMSEWSEWTMCRQPCNGQQTQKRVRNVLRNPGSYSMTRPCHPQMEERACQRQKNCIEYSWEIADWTSCLVNGGSAECGVGHKERFAICRNEVGEKVEGYRCEELFGPVTEPLVVSCEIPCDNDCLMSDWSDWAPCSTTCGLGFTTRKRTVLQSPMGNGRKCPEKLDQSKSCFLTGCFRWYVSEWSRCSAEKGICGSGIQDRNVSCLTDDGRPVNSSKCPVDQEKLVMQTSRPCHVPCPGECFLSDWSAWSMCYISCEDFQQGFIQGVQARSRAILANPSTGNPPCNGTLWEDQQCEANHCTFFRWITGDWDPRSWTRVVACERQDGLRVIGGCDDTQRPGHSLTCSLPRCVSPAFCADINVCDCPTIGGPYTLYEVNSTATTCVMNTTGPPDSALENKAEMAKTPNVWMYAVIVVGTVFVIAVTAALYNMCELFRKGPRPRPKGEGSREGSTTGTIHSVRSVQGNCKGNTAPGNGSQRCENLYKQMSRVDADDVTVLTDNELSSFPSRNNSHYTLTPPLPHDHQDIPDGDAVTPTTTTPLPSSVSTVTTNVTTTTTTPLSPKSPPSLSIGPPPLTTGISRTQVGQTKHDSSSRVSLKTNRRYKRLHRLLPSRFAQCFSCDDKTATPLVGVRASDSGGLELISEAHSQSMSLTRAHATENIELCGGEFYTNTTSGFQLHNCMLPRCPDSRPSELDLTRHSNTYSDFDITVQPRKLSIPLASEIKLELGRASPMISRTFIPHAGTREDLRLVTHTSCGSSSDSLAMSSDLISGKHEGSSQCSLQLGDTAETLLKNDSKPRKEFPSRHQIHQQRPTSFAGAKQATAAPMQPSASSHGKLSSGSPCDNDTGQPTSSDRLDMYSGHNPSTGRSLKCPSSKISGASTDNLCYPAMHETSVTPAVAEGSLYSEVTPQSRLYSHRARRPLSTSASPLSFSSDYVNQPSTLASPHSKQPNPRLSRTTTKPLVSPPYRGADPKVSPSTTIPTSRSFASLPESLIQNPQKTRRNPPLLEKASQDSGHVSIPRSRTVSPGEFSLDNADVMTRTASTTYIQGAGYPPLHIQTSMESGHDSPTSSLCHSCKRGLHSPGLYVLASPDSASQASNISGLETSV